MKIKLNQAIIIKILLIDHFLVSPSFQKYSRFHDDQLVTSNHRILSLSLTSWIWRENTTDLFAFLKEVSKSDGAEQDVKKQRKRQVSETVVITCKIQPCAMCALCFGAAYT